MDEELKEALKNIEVAEKDEGGLTEFLDSLDSVIESSDAKTNSGSYTPSLLEQRSISFLDKTSFPFSTIADLEDSRSIEVLKDEDYSED